MNINEAAIYVGTYAKYNNGSIAGKWLKLADYDDQAKFYEACQELHSDEDDPELMFQDNENIPDHLVSESHIDEQVWAIMEAIESSHLDAEVFEAATDLGIDLDDIEEAYAGEFGSDSDFAYDMAEQLGQIDEQASWPHSCIDWEHAAIELMYDYSESNGHYFRNF